MTTELWTFLGQAVLLGVGAIITIILVPHFTNKFHEKQKEEDIVREQRQKDIDRERDDHKQQLEIQNQIITKTSKIFANLATLISFEGKDLKGKKISFNDKEYTKMFSENFETQSIISLYYDSDSQIFKEYMRIMDTSMWFVDNIAFPSKNEDEEKQELGKLLKKINNGMDLETAWKMFKAEHGLYDLSLQLVGGVYEFLKMLEDTPPNLKNN